jgi:hypothetical protein
MKLVEHVITRVATRDEIAAWTAQRRRVLIDLLENELLVLAENERRAA